MGGTAGVVSARPWPGPRAVDRREAGAALVLAGPIPKVPKARPRGGATSEMEIGDQTTWPGHQD